METKKLELMYNSETGKGCMSCKHLYKGRDEYPCGGCKKCEMYEPKEAELTVAKNHIKPDYYNDTKITPFYVIDSWGLGFYLGNVIKYIKRAGKKDNNSRLQDLMKAQEYLSAEIAREEDRMWMGEDGKC